MILGESVIKKVIPDFHLYKLGHVRSFSLHTHSANGVRPITDLILSVSYPYDDQTYLITLKLSDVHQLRLPEIGPYGLQLSELEIHSIQDHMMEGINFHVEDFADDGMSCECREVRLVSVGKLEWNESESVMWATDNVNGSEFTRWMNNGYLQNDKELQEWVMLKKDLP